MELLHIGKRVKFASYTVYSSWNEVLGSISICSFQLPFHIPYQYGAPTYAKATTSRDMTTPHAPTAILLSHLQALYNIIILTFINAISLFLGHCRRHRCYCNSTTGRTGGRRRRRKCRSQRGRWPPRRLHYHTKIKSRDRGLVAERGSFELLTDVNHEVKYGALFWSCNRTIDSITDSNDLRW